MATVPNSPFELTFPILSSSGAPVQTDTDGQSVTSTVEYEWCNHESFATYQHKISEIAAQHFHCDISDIEVEHMKGGSYNRVAGITIRKKMPIFSLQWLKATLADCLGRRELFTPEQYVIRIPRYGDEANIDEDLAILDLAARRVALPTPTISAFDKSTHNILNSPYMIQHRMPGQNLERLWSSLNLQQRRSAAEQIAALPTIIASSLHGPPGSLSKDNLGKAQDDTVDVYKFHLAEDQPLVKSTEQSPFEHLVDQCERWRKLYSSDDPEWAWHGFWDQFTVIAQALQARGFLDGLCVLIHGDLEVYNLLARVKSNTEVEITGVIDWDMAFMGPEFMAYRAPFWLWTPQTCRPSVAANEGNANRIPVTVEERTLKQAFLENASETYLKFAFAPEVHLARRMMKILREGVPSTWHILEAQNVISDWVERYPEDGVELVHYLDDPDEHINEDRP